MGVGTATATADAGTSGTSGGLVRPLPPFPEHWRSLPRVFLHQARARPKKVAMADSSGTSLTYSQVLMRSLALGRVLERTLGPSKNVGVLIPPNVPCAVANLALSF